MLRKSIFTGIAVIALVLPQAGCVEVDNPLSDPHDAKIEKRLLGAWKSDKDGATLYHFFGRLSQNDIKNAPEGLIVWRCAAISEAQELDWQDVPVYCFVTRISEDCYLNVISPKHESQQWKDWKQRDIRAYSIAKLTFGDDTVSVQFMDNKRVARIIDDGKLAGKVIRNNTPASPRVRLTDSTENLTNYLKNQVNPPLFDDDRRVTLRRMK